MGTGRDRVGSWRPAGDTQDVRASGRYGGRRNVPPQQQAQEFPGAAQEPIPTGLGTDRVQWNLERYPAGLGWLDRPLNQYPWFNSEWGICTHEYSRADLSSPILLCQQCGAPAPNLDAHARRLDYSLLKPPMAPGQIAEGGVAAPWVYDFLCAMEPFVPVLTYREGLEARLAINIAEDRVRAGIKALAGLTVMSGMLLANRKGRRVPDAQARAIASVLFRHVLEPGQHLLMPFDFAGWSGQEVLHMLEGGSAEQLVGNVVESMENLVSWLASVSRSSGAPIGSALLPSWTRLFDQACGIARLGVSGPRDTVRQRLAARLRQLHDPVRPVPGNYSSPQAILDQLTQLITDHVRPELRGLGYFVTYSTAHRAFCSRSPQEANAYEGLLRERLLKPALASPEHFRYAPARLNPFADGGLEDLDEAERFWEIDRIAHRWPVSPAPLVEGPMERKFLVHASFASLIGRYHLSSGYPTPAMRDIQASIAGGLRRDQFDFQMAYARRPEVDVERLIRDQVPDEQNRNRIRRFAAASGSLPREARLNNHLVFFGSSGTGKTTVAKVLSTALAAQGILSSGHVVTASRADIVGAYVGQTAARMRQLIDEASGGVLLLDEAYALKPPELGSSNDFGQEAIDALLLEMENRPTDLVVVLAGHAAAMRRFLEATPVLASRFPNVWEFPDLSPEQLTRIFSDRVQELGCVVAPDVAEKVGSLARAQGGRPSFGNARWAINLADRAVRRHLEETGSEGSGSPVLALPDLADDSTRPGRPRISIDDAVKRLDELVGLEGPKKRILDLVALHNLNARRVAQGLAGIEVAQHLIFCGPPGTGKTALARLLGDIYHAAGILRSGHLVEASRTDLVAGYAGQTAIKTTEVVDAARDGVLLLDDAYTLTDAESQQGDTGMEAVNTLIKLMEDHRGSLVVIAAGHTEGMRQFVRSSPGLASRFTATVEFPPLSLTDFATVCERWLDGHSLSLSPDAVDALAILAAAEVGREDYASGRSARSLCERIVVAQARRLLNEQGADVQRIEAGDVWAAAES